MTATVPPQSNFFLNQPANHLLECSLQIMLRKVADKDLLLPPKDEEATEQVIFDRDNPRSLINIVWPELRAKIDEHVELVKKHFNRSEYDLRKEMKHDRTITMLRARLWQEYDSVQQSNTTMLQNRVTVGICSRDYFHESVCNDAKKLAYLLTCPPRYFARLESMHIIALDELLDILAFPIEKADGTVDHKVMSHKIKIFELLDLRVKGAIAQKVQIDQRVVTKSLDDPLKGMDLNDLQSLDAGINRVRKQIERVQSGGRDAGFIDIGKKDKDQALLPERVDGDE